MSDTISTSIVIVFVAKNNPPTYDLSVRDCVNVSFYQSKLNDICIHILYNGYGDEMKYTTRDILQEKLKQVQQYQITCFYAPRGSGKTKQIKAYYASGHTRRKWIDLRQYPLHRQGKVEKLQALVQQLSRDTMLILDHYEDAYFFLPDALQQTHTILLITDMLQDPIHRNWRYIDFHDICFSKQELLHICEWNEISIADQDLTYIHNATFGWFPAAEIYLEYYRHHRKIMEVQYLNARMMELCSSISQKLSDMLPVISLCNSFSMELCSYMGAKPSVLQELETLASHGWMIRKSADQQHYEIATALRHFLKRELLYRKQDVLDTHRRLALWCETHHEMKEALYHYYQAVCYDDIIRILENSQSVTFVDEYTDITSEIYRNIPIEKLQRAPYAYLRVINDMLTSLDVRKGMAMLKDFESRLASYTVPRHLLQGELQLLYGYMSINDLYSMNACFKKAHAYFQGETSRISNIGMNVTLGSPHTMYIYHRTPKGFEALVSYIEQELSYYMDITNNLNAGFIQQAKAELLLETANFRQALQKAWEGYYVAQTYRQVPIMICSMFTILRCAYMLQDDELLHMGVDRLRQTLENNTNVYEIHAVYGALGYVYVITNQMTKAVHCIRQMENLKVIDANYYFYVVKGVMLLRQGEYEKLKATANILLIYYRQKTHVIGEIYACIFTAVCSWKQSKTEEAGEFFQKAMEMSSADNIQTPYLELYSDILPLIKVFRKDPFLKQVIRRYEKLNYVERLRNSALTQKEIEIANLLARGYTRKDIAGMQHVSIETVHSHAKNIFSKMKIRSRSELIELFQQDEIDQKSA